MGSKNSHRIRMRPEGVGVMEEVIVLVAFAAIFAAGLIRWPTKPLKPSSPGSVSVLHDGQNSGRLGLTQPNSGLW